MTRLLALYPLPLLLAHCDDRGHDTAWTWTDAAVLGGLVLVTACLWAFVLRLSR